MLADALLAEAVRSGALSLPALPPGIPIPDPTPIASLEELPVSSRLLEYELWNRLHACKLESPVGDNARVLLGRIAMLELTPLVLARALEPFPVAARTLDALHLASLDHLLRLGQRVTLATYDARQAAVAQRMGVVLAELDGEGG